MLPAVRSLRTRRTEAGLHVSNLPSSRPWWVAFSSSSHLGSDIVAIKADLEELVLSGKLFTGGSRSSSPERSPSPDAVKWPNDADYDSEQEGRDNIKKAVQSQGDMGQQESIGMGPGRTGVKGVIRDRNEAESTAKSKQRREMEEMNRKMEKASLGGKTFLEEEKERLLEKAILEGSHEITFSKGNGGKAKFGHLREVGLDGFLRSVEQEERGVWVVIHIYDPVCFYFASLYRDDNMSFSSRWKDVSRWTICLVVWRVSILP